MTEVEKKHYKKMVEWAVGTHFQASLVEISDDLEISSVEAEEDMVNEKLQGAQTLTWTYMSHLRNYT